MFCECELFSQFSCFFDFATARLSWRMLCVVQHRKTFKAFGCVNSFRCLFWDRLHDDYDEGAESEREDVKGHRSSAYF